MVGVVGSNPIAPTKFLGERHGYDTANYTVNRSLTSPFSFNKSAAKPRFFFVQNL
jgi:hypothetical protein